MVLEPAVVVGPREPVVVLEPASGRLTGSDSGPGRMLEPAQIADATRAVLCRPRVPQRKLRVVVQQVGCHEHVLGHHSRLSLQVQQ